MNNKNHEHKKPNIILISIGMLHSSFFGLGALSVNLMSSDKLPHNRIYRVVWYILFPFQKPFCAPASEGTSASCGRC